MASFKEVRAGIGRVITAPLRGVGSVFTMKGDTLNDPVRNPLGNRPLANSDTPVKIGDNLKETWGKTKDLGRDVRKTLFGGAKEGGENVASFVSNTAQGAGNALINIWKKAVEIGAKNPTVTAVILVAAVAGIAWSIIRGQSMKRALLEQNAKLDARQANVEQGMAQLNAPAYNPADLAAARQATSADVGQTNPTTPPNYFGDRAKGGVGAPQPAMSNA